MKERLFDSIGLSSRGEKIRLNLAATSVLYYIAEQFMVCALPLILENNFENKTAGEIVALLKKFSYKAISVVLTGDYQRIFELFCARQHNPDRHRGHIVNDRYPEEDLFSRFRLCRTSILSAELRRAVWISFA